LITIYWNTSGGYSLPQVLPENFKFEIIERGGWVRLKEEDEEGKTVKDTLYPPHRIFKIEKAGDD